MEPDTYLPPKALASSAVDLTGTLTGLANSTPSSPSARQDSFTRRRLSWGRVDAGQDPLRTELRSFASTSSDSDRNIPPDIGRPTHASGDGPFYSPLDDTFTPRGSLNGSPSSRYQNEGEGAYSTIQPGTSSAYLMRSDSVEDDQARLTTDLVETSQGESWNQLTDAERDAGTSTRSRRRTVEYSAPPSPFKMTGTALKRVSRELRRVSLRVVNFGGTGLESRIRLPDDEDDKSLVGADTDYYENELPDLSQSIPLRGRTLGFLGPTNRFRSALYRFLVYT